MVNRVDSLCSLTRATFEASARHSNSLASDKNEAFLHNETTGKPIGVVVLNISSDTLVINAGKSNCRNGDIAVAVRHVLAGPLLMGIIDIERVYSEDLEGYISHRWVGVNWEDGVMPEDTVLVINRATSDCSLARVSFRLPKQ